MLMYVWMPSPVGEPLAVQPVILAVKPYQRILIRVGSGFQLEPRVPCIKVQMERDLVHRPRGRYAGNVHNLYPGCLSGGRLRVTIVAVLPAAPWRPVLTLW